jgi:hypothetical protein
MHSQAAVALTPRLAAILRLDMPTAHSLSTSRILRMGNLDPGIAPAPCGKRAKSCRFADHPTAARHPRPQAGRDRPEWVVAINRNAWSQSIGTAGRNHPVRAVMHLVKDLPPLYEAFYNDVNARTCKKCGALHPGKKPLPDWAGL